MPNDPSRSPAPPPAAIAAGERAAVVGGDNRGTINTGVVVNIQGGDDFERNREIARTVLEATRLARAPDEQRRKDVAAYYRAIARTLDEAAKALRAGSVPHGKCGEMRGYAEHLQAEIGDLIGEPQAEALARELMESYEVERFGAAYMGLPEAERDEKFAVLEEAAGYFRAAAKSLKVRR